MAWIWIIFLHLLIAGNISMPDWLQHAWGLDCPYKVNRKWKTCLISELNHYHFSFKPFASPRQELQRRIRGGALKRDGCWSVLRGNKNWFCSEKCFLKSQVASRRHIAGAANKKQAKLNIPTPQWKGMDELSSSPRSFVKFCTM